MVFIENPVIQKFIEDCYQEETRQFLIKTESSIVQSADHIRETVFRALDGFYEEVIKKQAQGAPPVTYINLSVLYTSVYFNAPSIRIEAYGEDWYMEDAIAEGSMDASWLFTEWEAYVGRLEQYRKKHMERALREETLAMLLRNTVTKAIYVGMGYLKYILKDCDESDVLKDVKKNESFYLTYGEYRDWQRTMYAEQPEAQIDDGDEEVPKTFRLYKDQQYMRQELEFVKANGSTFERCRWKFADLKNLELNDCVFNECIFEQMTMESIKCYGSTFIGCHFIDVSCRDVCLGFESRKGIVMDLYKTTSFFGGSMRQLTLTDCDLSDLVVNECRKTSITRVGGNIERSVFEFTEEGEEMDE